MKSTSTVECAFLSDVGHVREHNEDACAVDEDHGLFVVCDGMGGAAAGEIASQVACQVFLDQARAMEDEGDVPWRLHHAVLSANDAVFAEAERDPAMHGMGTTLVALELEEQESKVWTAHVGDSRCYRLRNGVLDLLTGDHSYVEEQVRMGVMTPEQADVSPLRNVITRAVGSRPDVEVEVAGFEAQKDDLYLLCTDGLTGEVTDEELADILRAGEADLMACARALVQRANAKGGNDNITVVLAKL